MNLSQLISMLVGAGIALVVTKTDLEASGYIVAGLFGIFLLSKVHARIQNASDENKLVRFYQHLTNILLFPPLRLKEIFKGDRARHGSGGFAEGFLSVGLIVLTPVSIAAYVSIAALCMGASMVAIISGGIFVGGAVLTYCLFD